MSKVIIKIFFYPVISFLIIGISYNGFSQTISNSSVYISISSGTVVNCDIINIDAASTLDNSGTINFISLTNSGIIQGSGLIALTGNLNNSGTFNSGTQSLNIIGSTAQLITSNSALSFKNFLINNSFSPIVMNQNFTIKGNIQLTAGNLSIGNNTLILNGSIIGSSPSNTFIGSSSSNITINAFVGNSGTLYFNQNSDGISNALNNLVFTGTAKFQLGNKLSLYGKMDIGSGKFDLANNRLVIKSIISGNAVPTGYIAALNSTSSDPTKSTNSLQNYTNVTVERALTSNNNRAWRLLSPTVLSSTPIRTNWQEGVNTNSLGQINNPNPGYGTEITGSGGSSNGFDVTETQNPSLYSLNPITSAYVAVANTTSTILDPTTGYLIYIRGDRSIDLESHAKPFPSANTTLRTTGTLLTGDQQYKNLQGGTSFNLISNPYPSSINWSSIYNDAGNSGFISSYTLYDPNAGTQGAYVTVSKDGVTSMGNATVDIQSGQAFYIQANNATPVLTIKESHKSGNNNIDIFGAKSQDDFIRSTLYFNLPDNTRRAATGAIAIFNDKYSKGNDEYDADGLANFDETLWYTSNGNYHSIESRPVITSSDTLQLSLGNLKVQQYELQFEASFSTSVTAELVDNFILTRTTIDVNNTTVVPFSITTDPASKKDDRFFIVFKKFTPLPLSLLNFEGKKAENGNQLNWLVANESSINSYEVESSSNGQNFTKIGSIKASNIASNHTYNYIDSKPFIPLSFYRLKIIENASAAHFSNIVQITRKSEDNSMHVYPNPVKDKKFTLQISELLKGTYHMCLTDKMGRLVFQTDFYHEGGWLNKNIDLNMHLSKGIYTLKCGSFVKDLLIQ